MGKSQELKVAIKKIKEQSVIDRFVDDVTQMFVKHRTFVRTTDKLAVELSIYSRYFGGKSKDDITLVDVDDLPLNNPEYLCLTLEEAKKQPAYIGTTGRANFAHRVFCEGIDSKMYVFCKELKKEGFDVLFIYSNSEYSYEKYPILDNVIILIE